jgi:flagella basal body P-ring formation protein FlgA
MEERDVTTVLGRYVRDPAELAGKRAKMRIAYGRMIDVRYLEPIPVVNRGDQVCIRAKIGTVTVSALGLSTESGAVGDRIVVKNVDSREKLVAEVVAAGVVQVAF